MFLAQTGIFRGGVWSILADTGIFARVILLILFVFSVASWAVMIERWFLFRRARRHTRDFTSSFGQAQSAATTGTTASHVSAASMPM